MAFYNRIGSLMRQSISQTTVVSNGHMFNAFRCMSSEPQARQPISHRRLFLGVIKIIGKSLDSPIRMWRRTETEWLRLVKTKRGCRLLLKDPFLQQLRSSMQDEELERTKKFGSEKVCLGRFYTERSPRTGGFGGGSGGGYGK